MINDNLIINGNFDLWQRGISFAIENEHEFGGSTFASPNTKIADRWYLIDTQSRNGGITSGNIQAYKESHSENDSKFALSKNYLTIANQINGATLGYCYVENKQENANVFGNIQLTLSFYAKNNSGGLTGATMSCYYRQAINPNIFEYGNIIQEIEVNPYWEFNSISFTPIFVANSGLTGEHYFSIGFRLNRNTTISISSVKLEIGNTPTTLITDPEEEKKRQERYYITTYPLGTLQESQTLSGGNDLNCLSFSVTPNYSYNLKFDKPQYKTPTISFYSPNSGIADGYNKSAGKDMRLTSGTSGWNLARRFSPTGASTLLTTASTYGVTFRVSSGAVVFDDILVHFVSDADITPGDQDRGLET